MQTRISLDFNVDGITKVIQETNKLEKKFEAVGDKISSQSNKVKNLVSSVKELNALLNGKSELGGAGNVEAFSESVQSSLLQAIEMAKQLQTALNNINVPAEITGGLNTIVNTGNKVLNTSPVSYSSSDIKALKEISNLKPAKVDSANVDDMKAALSEVQKLEAEYSKLSGGKDIKTPKIDSKTINTVIQYANALSKLEGVMTYIADGFAGKSLNDRYLSASEMLGGHGKDVVDAFSKQYEPQGNTGYFKQWQKEFTKNNKELLTRAESSAQQATQQATKSAEGQATTPIKVTVDKDALTNDITTAIQSKEYTINVKPQQNIADDIQKQLEGKVANINIVAGASKGVASVNSQISDFQSAYDKYVGIVNSGKGSTASLLKQYPLLSDYKKGMDVEKTKSELTGKFANQITAGSSKEIEQLSKSLTALTDASGGSEKVVESFNAIRNSAQTILPPDFDEKILNLIDGLELLESHLAKSDIGSSPFIKTINELLSKGDELKALASVLADAQKGAGKSLAKEATKEEKIVRANQSDINTVWNSSVGQMSYKGIEDAIIERSALRGKDVTDMDQLRKDIALNLTKQGSIKNAEQIYDKLAEAKMKVNNIHISEDDEAGSFEKATAWALKYREALDEVVKNPTKENLARVALTQTGTEKYYDRAMSLQENYAKTTQVNKIRDSISKDINQNSKMPLDMLQRYQSLQKAMEATYDSQGNKIAVTTEQYNKMQAVYSNLRAEMQATGQVGNSLFTKLGTGLGARIVQFTSFYLSFYRVIQYMRQGIETLEQFDTTLTKISYTMNVSEATLKDMGNSMQIIASDLSAPLDNVEKIYTVYANMKTDPKEVEQLTKYTTILSNLAGIDASAAADDVQGVIQQFGLAAKDTSHIVDTFDYISANIAVDYSKGIEGLSEAVQGSGNVAKMAGLSFEQYGSIIAKVMEQTRMDGSRVSNAMRTIMTRLSKASTMDDTVDNASLSKASESLNKIGIQVYKSNGEYREFDTIMTELAAKWDSLTDAQRENISFSIAATRQTAMLKAVLNNWTDSMDLATEATENNGSAMKNQEKYEKSLAGRLQSIKTEMQNFAVDFLDTDSVDNFIKVIKDLTSALSFLGETLGQVGTMAGILTTRSMISKKGAFTAPLTYNPFVAEGERKISFTKPFSLTSRQDAINFNKNLTPNIQGYIDLLKKPENGSFRTTKASESYLQQLEGFTEEEKTQIQMMSLGKKSAEEISGSMKKVGTASKIAASGTKILSAALSGILVGGVIAGISWVVEKIAEYGERAKQAREEIKQLNEEAATEEKDYNSGLRSITSINDSFMALNTGIDEQGNNISLTNTQLDEYYKLSNQVAELIPSLVTGYTEEGNAVISLTNNYKDLTEAYKETRREQLIKDNKDSLSTISKGLKNMDVAQDYMDEAEFPSAFRWAKDIVNWGSGILNLDKYQGGDALKALSYKTALDEKDDKKAAKIINNTKGLSTADKDVVLDNGKFKRDVAQKLYDAADAQANEALTAVKNGFYAEMAKDSSIDTDTVDYLSKLMKSLSLYNTELRHLLYEGSEADIKAFYNSFKDKFMGLSDRDRQDLMSLYGFKITDVKSAKKYQDIVRRVGGNIDAYKNNVTGLTTDLGIDKNNLEKWNYATQLQNIKTVLTQGGIDEEYVDLFLKGSGIDNYASATDFYNKIKGGYNTELSRYGDVTDYIFNTINNYRKKQSAFNFSEIWGNLGATDDGKKTKEKLLELANAGQLTLDTFSQTEGADTWLRKLGIEADDVIPKINQLADSAKQLGALSGNVNSIREAYGEKRDEGIVGASTLSSMSETFGQLDYWKQYEEIVGTKSSTLSEVKAASDKLLTEYVNTGNYLANLSKDNKQYYIDQLSDMGVANAVEVVNNKLKQQDSIIKDIHGDEAFSSLGRSAQVAATSFTSLQDATDEEIGELVGLSGISALTKNYLIQLQLTKLDWDNLNAEDAIAKLKSIAASAGVAVEELSNLATAQDYIDRASGMDKAAKGLQADIDAGMYSGEDLNIAKGRVAAFKQGAKDLRGKAKKETQKSGEQLQQELNKRINTATNVDVGVSTKGIDSKNGSGKDKKDKSDKDTKQQFDWLERRVNVITSKIDLLKSKLENLFSMKKKQSNLSKQIKEQTRLLKTYNKQVDIYGKKAAAVGLSSKLKKKVRNGQLRGTKAQLIQKYGENTANKIEKYQDWYDKKQTAKKNRQEAIAARRQLKIDKQQLYVDKYNAQAEYKDLASTSGSLTAGKRNALLTQEYNILKKSYKHQIKIAKINHDYTQVSKLELELANKRVELEKKKFDNVATQYDRLLKIMGYGIDKIESSISIIEARGAKANVNQFRAEAQGYSDQGALLDLEIAALKKRLSTIQKGTSEWYDANDELNSKVKERAEIEVKQIEMMNKVREAYTDLYTAIEAQIERINTEQNFARDLTSDYEYFDFDTGVITDMGKAYSSSLMTSMYASQENLANDKERLRELQSFLNPDGTVNEAGQRRGYQSVDVLLDDIDAVFDMEQKHIKEIADQRANLAKFVEDSLKKEEDLLKKLIDKRKEELDAAKDLHDYQKSIQEKTNNINDIQRQISAYRGDTSQEGMSKLQQLQQQLLEAQDDLQETEYDKYISDQKQMLDNLYADYQDLLEAKLSEFENLVNDGFNMVAQYSEEGNALMDAFLQGLGYDIQYNDNGSKRQTSVTVSNLEEMRKRLSGTQGDNGSVPDANQSRQTAQRSVQQTKEDYWKSIYNKQTVKQAGDVFAHRLVKGKYKTADEYKTSINRHLFKANGGKVLSNDGLERMRVVLGIGDNSEMLEILQWLSKNIGNIPHVKGFAKGGMVGDVVKRNGDDGFATLKVGEAVLTPVEAQQFKKLVTALPSLNNLTSELNSIKDRDIGLQSSNTFGDTYIDINLPNVENSTDFLNAIKNDDKIQKALQDVTVNRLNGGSRLGVKKIR